MKRLQGVTRGYNRFVGVTGVTWGYKRLHGGYKGLHRDTRGFKGLQGVPTGYEGLHRDTRGYKGLQGGTGVTKGYKELP